MIEEIYTEALLAAAAYADWSASSSDAEIKAELMEKRGFTEAQYAWFRDNYSVVAYTEEPNGFSATIFENTATGELTVAFRGSDDLLDWLTTNLGVLAGKPSILDAINDLFGQENSIEDFLIQAGLDVGGALTQPVNFTGHSLGGFLTTMASYMYSTTMGQASTFNGLGVELDDFMSKTSGGISLDGKISNYYADLVGRYAGRHPGSKTELFIEYDGVEDDLTFESHSIAKLVESLSVCRILGKLDPTLDSARHKAAA